jgi:hypothetical protein
MRLKLPIALALGLVVGVASVAVVSMSALADPPPQGYAPDPAPKGSTKQWLFRIDVKNGKPSLASVRSKELEKPEASPRVMGRYALELWIGKELLDRVRFNVPGAADLPSRDDKSVLKRPAMDRINTHFTVRMADNPRAVALKLVDRATGDELTIPWPPDDEGTWPSRDAGAVSGDAGKRAVGGDAGVPLVDAGAVDGSIDAAPSRDAGEQSKDAGDKPKDGG